MNRQRAALLGVAAVPPAVVALVLVALGFRSALGLAPQASALSPYGSLHDLPVAPPSRWDYSIVHRVAGA